MMLSFNIGETLYVKMHNITLAVKCVADDPREKAPDTCKHCIFNGYTFHCFNIACQGRHFEFIDGKEVE